MSVDKKDFIEMIAKLNAMTQHKEITWAVCPSPTDIQADPDRTAISSFKTYVNDNYLRITKYEYTAIVDPLTAVIFSQKNEKYRAAGYRLEIIDHSYAAMFTFPHIQGIEDLFYSVSVQVSNVEEFVKDILRKPNETSLA